MSISDLHPRPRPVQVLAELVAAVRDLDTTWWVDRSDEELVETTALIGQARSALAAVESGVVEEADARDLARRRLHYGSTGDWLTHLGGLREGEGRRVVERAHALTGPLAATREALAAGRVSPAQAEVIVGSVDQLPLGQAVRSRGEQVLLEHAGSLDASDLARTGRHLVHVVDPDATDRKLERQLAREERAAHLSRFLSVRFDTAGGVRVRGRGSAEDGALLKAALLPLTSPAPAVDDHDATLVHDPRDAGARMWDALVRTAQHALDTELPPASHGAPTRLTVTTTLEALRTGIAAGNVDTRAVGAALPRLAGPAGLADLSVATIRRLACDAEVIPAVLGSTGEVLDVGRARRLVTAGIWTALVLRDRHCAFPGCHRPPLMCHAHHLTHWISGGRTSLDNLVLLCGHHHRVIHDTPWQARLHPDDRRPEFLPPPKPGVENRWIRYRPRLE